MGQQDSCMILIGDMRHILSCHNNINTIESHDYAPPQTPLSMLALDKGRIVTFLCDDHYRPSNAMYFLMRNREK